MSSLLIRKYFVSLGIFFVLLQTISLIDANLHRLKRQGDGEENPSPPEGAEETSATEEKESTSETTNESIADNENKELTIVATDEWIQAAVNKINEYREQHGNCPLTVDKNLCKASQKRANAIAAKGSIDVELTEGTGENVFDVKTPIEDYIPDSNLAIDNWYEDKNKYDFGTGKPKNPDENADAFTQLIWKDSSTACITFANSGEKDNENEYFVSIVANFFPIGNVEGEFVANVPPEVELPSAQTTPTKISSSHCPTAKVSASKLWLQNVLEVHNMFRKLHKAPPLILNNDLSEISQAWANKMAETNHFEHNSNCLKDSKLGENLYFSSSSTKTNEPPNGTRAVFAWYEEISNYDYTTTESKNGQEILHFTQLVWKDTKEMGGSFAISKTPNQNGLYSTYVVVNYAPRGNFDDFVVNVQEPQCKNMKISDLVLPNPNIEHTTQGSAETDDSKKSSSDSLIFYNEILAFTFFIQIVNYRLVN